MTIGVEVIAIHAAEHDAMYRIEVRRHERFRRAAFRVRYLYESFVDEPAAKIFVAESLRRLRRSPPVENLRRAIGGPQRLIAVQIAWADVDFSIVLGEVAQHDVQRPFVVGRCRYGGSVGGVGKDVVHATIIVDGEADVVQVAGALNLGGAVAHLLHGRKKEADQDGDDGDDHQQLDQRKGGTARGKDVGSHGGT